MYLIVIENDLKVVDNIHINNSEYSDIIIICRLRLLSIIIVGSPYWIITIKRCLVLLPCFELLYIC